MNKRMLAIIAGSAMALSTSAFAQSSADKMFVQKAAEGGLLEVQLGQLAAQKATDSDVKQFGQKMVNDHTKLNDQMKPFAAKLGVTPPTTLDAKDQAMYDRLNRLSGPAFDQAYVHAMVRDHREDLKEFTKEVDTTQDQDLKATVMQGRDVIHQHLTLIEGISKRMGGNSAGM